MLENQSTAVFIPPDEDSLRILNTSLRLFVPLNFVCKRVPKEVILSNNQSNIGLIFSPTQPKTSLTVPKTAFNTEKNPSKAEEILLIRLSLIDLLPSHFCKEDANLAKPFVMSARRFLSNFPKMADHASETAFFTVANACTS